MLGDLSRGHARTYICHPPSINHEPHTYVQTCARKDTLAARFFISHFDAMESVSRLVGRLQHLPSYRPVCCNRPASPLNRPCRSCVANGVKGCPLVGVLDQTEVYDWASFSRRLDASWQRCTSYVIEDVSSMSNISIDVSSAPGPRQVYVSSTFRLIVPPPTPPSRPGNR